MSLSAYSLVYSSSDLIQTIRLVTPASGISNKQRLNHASGWKAEDEILYFVFFLPNKTVSSAVDVTFWAARSLTFAEI